MILTLNIVVFLVFCVYNTIKNKDKNKVNQKTLFLTKCILCGYFWQGGTKFNSREIYWKGNDDKWVSITLIA